MIGRDSAADPYAEWDAAYILGALSPGERREYEEHLTTCDRCAGAIGELSAMPRLLGLVAAGDVMAATADPGPVPETVLAGLVSRTRAARRQRMHAAVAGLSAACLVVVAVVGWSLRSADRATTSASAPIHPPTSTTSLRTVVLRSVQPRPVRATVSIRPVTWGTSLRVTCTYVGSVAPAPGSPLATYALVLVPSDGSAPQRVADWRTLPGDDVVAEASTALAVADISSVQLQSDDGTVLLQASPS